jgi:hypothetical protein
MTDTGKDDGDALNEERLRSFNDRVDPVMTALALVWLPVLIVPLVTTLHGWVAFSFAAIDYSGLPSRLST